MLGAVRDTATDVALVAGAVTAFLTATALVWTRVFRPILRISRQAEETIPILTAIAAEFRPNHGSSLHDRISRLTELATDSAQVGADLGERVKQIEGYVHQFRHEIREVLAVRNLVSDTTPRLLGVVHDQLKELGVSMEALSELREIREQIASTNLDTHSPESQAPKEKP